MPTNPIRSSARRLGRWYLQRLCRLEYASQGPRQFNERAIEFAFVFRSLVQCHPDTVLDVGTGTTALPHLMRNCGHVVTAIDNIRDYWTDDVVNRHYHVIDDDITNTKLKQKFDLITCVSVLEHIADYDRAVETMRALLNHHGHLLLTFPYNEHRYVDNVYKLPEASYGQQSRYICQVYSREQLDTWSERYGLRVVEQEYWDVFSGELWTFGTHLVPPRQVDKDQKHQLTCVLLEAH
jgi:SAM-dependent methyltransferase